MSPIFEDRVNTTHVKQFYVQYYNSYWNGNFQGFGAKFYNSEWVPVIIIPLLAAVILVASVFLLIVFRQNPTFVITAVTGCLIFIMVYLVLSALDSTRVTYE